MSIKWFYCYNESKYLQTCQVSRLHGNFTRKDFCMGTSPSRLYKLSIKSNNGDFVIIITCHATRQYSYIAAVYLNYIFMHVYVPEEPSGETCVCIGIYITGVEINLNLTLDSRASKFTK